MSRATDAQKGPGEERELTGHLTREAPVQQLPSSALDKPSGLTSNAALNDGMNLFASAECSRQSVLELIVFQTAPVS